jgi:hypothetical protein
VDLRTLATEHGRTRAALAERLRQEARSAWARVDSRHIAETWSAQVPRLLVVLTAAQHTAASSSDAYLTASLAAQGVDSVPVSTVNAAAFSGIASDGRDLASLLQMPGVIARTAFFQGAPLDRAMAAGDALAQLAAHTQIADAGRTADQAGLVARPQVTGYVRMVVGKTCSRCLVLAGRRYRWNAGFKRHPKCDCVHVPAAEDAADDLRTDPKLAFRGMDAAEQDRVFGKAGAQAIREGSDISKVVNARRGMVEADGRLFTHEAAGRRPRLMPEQIYRDAEDREDAVRLLKLHGYLF